MSHPIDLLLPNISIDAVFRCLIRAQLTAYDDPGECRIAKIGV